MKRSEMSDAAISGSMARTLIFTRDCFVARLRAPRNDIKNS